MSTTISTRIPVTTKVSEVPLGTGFLGKGGNITSTWQKWFSQISTCISRSQENKSGDLTNPDKAVIGSYRATRSGNIMQVNGSFEAGTYSSIIVLGIPVSPLVDSIALVQGGTGVLDTDGNFTMTCTSTSKILFSISYIANAPKETN